MADVGHHNSAAWLDHFELRSLDHGSMPAVATLAPKSDAGNIARFATPPRLERLGQHLTRLSGRPVRVDLVAGTSVRQNEPTPDAGASPAGAAHREGRGGIDRREALNLPLVRDALEVFPDAILVDARKEDPPKLSQEPPPKSFHDKPTS
jgi:hypothetical protein